ncbi:MAG: SET domain-containing protein-lysine N-methyltransferase [Nitrososphaerota archaeon]|nr:SET domain-containing protein-lysine N-methyltransferase [Nitrososphaerota archaeon]
MAQVGIQGILEVRKCPHGRGVFLLRPFKKGEIIQSFNDITITTTPGSPPWKRWALIIGRDREGEHLFWDEEPISSEHYWSNFLDHDNVPNVRFLIDVGNRKAELIAIRDITAGEELLINYKDYDSSNWSP